MREELLLLILAPRLGQTLAQLHAHRVKALQNSLLPLTLDLQRIGMKKSEFVKLMV